MIYKAPTSGFYAVKSLLYTSKPTGQFETVKNPDRRHWFQYWRPELITRGIYETVETLEAQKIIFLIENEEYPHGILYKVQ